MIVDPLQSSPRLRLLVSLYTGGSCCAILLPTGHVSRALARSVQQLPDLGCSLEIAFGVLHPMQGVQPCHRHIQEALLFSSALLSGRYLVCRGVWMGMLLLWCAASIIVPIIRAEGIVAVFFPFLVRQPQA